MRYRVREKVRHESSDPMLGVIAFTFDKGVHEPKSEQEEAALKVLVDAGLAEATTDDTSKEKSDGASEAARRRRSR